MTLDGGKRSDMQMTRAWLANLRKRPRPIVGRSVKIERIAGPRLCGAPHHKGQSRRPLVANDKPRSTPLSASAAASASPLPSAEIRETKAVCDAEPGKADRHVVGRSAQDRIIARCL